MHLQRVLSPCLAAILLGSACGGGDSDIAVDTTATTATSLTVSTGDAGPTSTAIGSAATPTTAPPSTTGPPGSSVTTAAAHTFGVAAGTHCYAADLSTYADFVELAVAADGSIVGTMRGSQHNEPEGLFWAISGDLRGAFAAGARADLELEVRVDGDTQNRTETWTVSDAGADDGRLFRRPLACTPAPTDDQLFDGGFLGWSTHVLDEPTTIRFAPGHRSTVLTDAAVLGERVTYLVGVSRGQTMTLDLASVESNAQYEVFAPSGAEVTVDGTFDDVAVDESGDYRVVIGATRGNTTYDLRIRVV